MDTPSSPKSGSYLGIVVGILAVIAVVLAAVALSKVSALSKKLDDVAALAARVDSMEASVKRVSDDSAKNVNNLRATYERYFEQINIEFANLRTQINKVSLDTKEMMDKVASGPAPKSSGGSGSGGPTVAPGTLSEDGTYVIKGGDTLGKVATQFGISLAELQAANPSVDSRKLKVGQKIVIPKK
jgi:LysM repeat protein